MDQWKKETWHTVFIPEKKLSKFTIGCWTVFKSAGKSSLIHTQIIKQATAVAKLAPTAIPQNSLGVPNQEQGSRTAKQITSQIRNSPVFPTSPCTCRLTKLDMFPAAKSRNTTHTPRQKISHDSIIYYYSVTSWFIKKTSIAIKLLSYKLTSYRLVVVLARNCLASTLGYRVL